MLSPRDKNRKNYFSEMLQISFGSNKHDDNVLSSILMQLNQPAFKILKGDSLCNIITQQSSNSSTIVSSGNCSVALLSCSLPKLGFGGLSINLNTSGPKVYTNRRFCFKRKFISSKTTHQIRFSYTRVPDNDNFFEKREKRRKRKEKRDKPQINLWSNIWKKQQTFCLEKGEGINKKRKRKKEKEKEKEKKRKREKSPNVDKHNHTLVVVGDHQPLFVVVVPLFFFFAFWISYLAKNIYSLFLCFFPKP